MKGDQKVAKKIYQDSLVIKRVMMTNNPPPRPNSHNINFVDLDPREEYLEDSLVPFEDIKEVQIGP